MIANPTIRLAVPTDAHRIAVMSRDLIEAGLGWRWTQPQVLTCIRHAATNVAVAHDGGALAGFGIMEYKDDEAHLMLLAVQPAQRRRRIGANLVAWLETAALTAGIGAIYVEARATNGAARAFYRHLGYREIKLERGWYRGVEDGVRLAKDLWV